MRGRIVIALCTMAACTFAVLCFVMPAQAKEVTVEAPAPSSYYESNLKATVTYDDDFQVGKTVKFTYNVTNNTDTLMYKVFAFTVGGQNVIDPSRAPYDAFTTDNCFEYAFYSPGTYELIFLAADGTSSLAKPSRFKLTITIPAKGDFKSLDSYIAEVTDQCNEECTAKDDTSQYAKALWLNDWIIDNIEYDNNLQCITAQALFAQKKGTCEAYHKAYCLLLNKVGIETRRVDSKGDNHVWTGAKLDGQWYNIDTTWNDAKQTSAAYPDVRHLYFGLTSSVMLLAHKQWDGKYEISYTNRDIFDAQSFADNYFIRSGEISKYTSAYLASNGTYSVKSHLDAREEFFSIPVENRSWPAGYKDIIYSLVAYQLSQANWGDGTVIAVAYSNTTSGEETLEFQADYDIANSSISISDATVLGPDAIDFTGQTLTPDFVIKIDEQTLAKDKDYEISYANNINVGTASVTITGKGKYFGTISMTFAINALNISNVSIGSIADQQYSGKALTPKLKVSYYGKQLIKDTDYTLKYENNTNPGTGKVTITGKGNYSGTATVSFNIVKQQSSSSSSSSSSATTTPGSSSSSSSSTKPSTSGSSSASPGTSTAPSTPAKVSGTWIKSGARWWYKYDGATQKATSRQYPYNEFVDINGVRYHFDSAGWMHTGWQKLSGIWYYFNGSGAMTKGWQYVGGAWYHLGTEGKMLTGWKQDGSAKYYLSGSGAMVTGWQKISGTWYFFNGSGAMTKGWQHVGGAWYHMASNGMMQTGWFDDRGTWYHLSSSGAMQTGWQKIDGIWYYFNGSGAMLKNRWVGNYWLGSDGKMATGAWVDNNKYYVDGNGAWVPNKKH